MIGKVIVTVNRYTGVYVCDRKKTLPLKKNNIWSIDIKFHLFNNILSSIFILQLKL